MSDMSYSITYVASAANRDAVNAYFNSLGWGANVLVATLSPNGEGPATHYGAHDYGSAELVATMQAAMASSDPALAALAGLFMYAGESDSPLYDVAIQSDECEARLGTKLMRYAPAIEW